MWLYVDEAEVVRTTAVGDVPPRLVNTSAAAFTRFLGVFVPEWQRRASLSDADAEAQTARLTVTLQQIDPGALTDADGWWALVLEQMSDDLL